MSNRRGTNWRSADRPLSFSQPVKFSSSRTGDTTNLTRQQEDNLLGVGTSESPASNMDTAGQSPSVAGNASNTRDIVSENPISTTPIPPPATFDADAFKKQLLNTIQLRGPEQGRGSSSNSFNNPNLTWEIAHKDLSPQAGMKRTNVLETPTNTSRETLPTRFPSNALVTVLQAHNNVIFNSEL